MYDVNLYIETSIKGPFVRDGHYIYVLEYITANGEPATICGTGYEEKASRQRLELTAVLAALNHMAKPSEIRVFTECVGILNPVKNGWLEGWKKNGWKNGKKETVKNADLWKKMSKKLKKHMIHEEHAEHTYKRWMVSELEKIVREKEIRDGK